jgi:hypothetical protein
MSSAETQNQGPRREPGHARDPRENRVTGYRAKLISAQRAWRRGRRKARDAGRSISNVSFRLASSLILLLAVVPMAGDAQAACTGNAIVCENQNPGTPQSTWDTATAAGDTSIQGYSTDISYNVGDTAAFKINSPSSAYTIDIYRMGYYQGNGARKITSITPSVSLPQTQPACLTDANTGLVDCGNWSVSASWPIPATAVSGIYFAKLKRTDISTSNSSLIVFVVRNDASTSPILFQTDDPTWEAYNQWGGNSIYKGNGPGGGAQPGRAYKVSYNRPFAVRGQESGYGPSNFVFYGEYPMVRFLESNGYDLSYFSGVDTDRRGSLLKNHRMFMSVGHDEYWSGGQRANVEAARDAGVNLAFFSGNESYWKTRYETSIDPSHTSYRTFVTYKESLADGPLDPQDPSTWTGLWRDPRFSPPADGGRPENSMTGTIFMVNRGSAAIQVPSTYAKLRFWRNTAVANLGAGQTATLGSQTLGYEWDEDLDNTTAPNGGPAARPAGLVDMSSTTVSGVDFLTDYGSTTAPATATHHLTLYRAPSGALVFGAGTVQWEWGLDVNHDVDSDSGPTTPDVNMQQATINLLADMGAQPTTIQAGLSPATASSDVTPPTSTIASPANGASIGVGTNVTISGTASDVGGVVGGVEVSTDGGTSWHPATGTTSWSFTWAASSGGQWKLMSRASDDSGNIQTTPASVTVNVTGDTAPPVVTGVTAAVSPSLATITWTTNEPSTSQVQYGTTTAYGSSTTLDTTLVTSHSVSVTGLQSAQTYDYRVISKDNAGNQTTTGNFSFATTVPAALVRLGDQTVEAHQDNNTSGSGEAFQYTATTSGSASRAYVFLDGANTASLVTIGVYTDNNNNPGTLLGQANITSPQANAWNSVALSGVNITAGSKYWIAILAPTTGTGSVYFRDVATGGLTKVSTQVNLSSLPATWTTGSTWSNAPMSAYLVDLSGPIDTTPPTVSVTAPVAGATVSGKTVTLSATASDNTSVSAVQFLVDGSAVAGADTTTPYQTTWDTTTATNGTHTISAQASDPSGNVGTSTNVSVTVNNVDSVPPAISGVASSSITATRATITWNTDKGSTSQVDYGTTTAYGTSTTLDPSLVTAHSVTVTGLTAGTTYHFRVDSKNSSGFGSSSSDATFATTAAPTCPCTIWPSTAAPVNASTNDNMSVEVGVKFRSDNDGYISGIRFYKGAGNTGTHTGTLWTVGGSQLATATFTNETASGWQQVNFATPVAVTAGIDYVATYHAPNGSYAADANAFSGKGVDNGTMHALADGVDGGNGVYQYSSATTFPTQTFSSTNYWVDAVFSLTPPAAPPPTTISGVATSGISNAGATINWTTNNPATSQVLYGTTTAYGSSTTLDATMVTSHSQNLTGLNGSTLYHYKVQSKDSTGATVSSSDATFTTTVAPTCPCAIWPSSPTPTNPAANDPASVEVGVKFRSDAGGWITSLRFYKSSGNTGTHVGSLWTTSGTLLGQATFSGESASGWQTVTFPGGIQINANTDYVASYHTNTGFYAADASFFTSAGVDSGPLHALKDGADGGNGVFAYGASSTFPNQSFSGTNYWVDVNFSTTAPTLPALTVTNVASSGVSAAGATVTWTTNNPASSQVLYGTTTAYGSSTTLDATQVTSHSVSITGLAASTTYHYKVQSKDASGSTVSSSDQTFTTTAAATCPCSIWSTTSKPVTAAANDSSAVEVGVKFRADRAGQVTGIRFYKGTANTGTHVGTLWTSTGTKLATATFAGESASGWQTVTFSTPVNITANTVYVASYHTNKGFYAADEGGLTNGVDNGVLHAVADAAAGGNGVYAYSASSTFPNQTFGATNYWVDVIFK